MRALPQLRHLRDRVFQIEDRLHAWIRLGPGGDIALLRRIEDGEGFSVPLVGAEPGLVAEHALVDHGLLPSRNLIVLVPRIATEPGVHALDHVTHRVEAHYVRGSVGSAGGSADQSARHGVCGIE